MVILVLVFLCGFITNTGSFPKPLSKEEEQENFEKYRNGDEKARNILIEKNLRLVVHVVKKYANCGYEIDDLISLGTIGLIKAVATFDSKKGWRIATYAARCIDKAITSLRKHLGTCTATRY